MKKVCSKCGEEKELDCFYLRKDSFKYRTDCNNCRSKYRKTYYIKNKKKEISRMNKYKRKKSVYKKHPRAYFYHKKWLEKKIKENPHYKIAINIRRSISNQLTRKGYSKTSKTNKILGCSYKQFKQHLESQFQEGMTWDNYGRNGWHIDHIYPVSKARDEEHLLELNHYTNLQPLWEKDNIAKGNRLDWNE